MATGNQPAMRTDNLKHTIRLWMESFAEVSDDLLGTAVRLALLNVKRFPMLSDIHDAIVELREEQLQNEKVSYLPSPRSRSISKAAEEAFDIVKSGKTKEFCQAIDVSDLMEYARYFFPDISEDSVRRNYAELSTARSYSVCFGCQWIDGTKCPSGGWYMVPQMEKTGYVVNQMAMCGKHPLAKKGASA